MSRTVTIVMYHYVRELKHSRYPAIKGLSTERFRRQLDHIQAHYTPITVEKLLGALGSGDRELPPNSILLTFDDGYADHFANVFPLLEARKIQGCFFPPAQAVLEHTVLDVNKIHFILASVPNPGRLLDRVFASLDEFRPHYPLKTNEAYLHALGQDHRFDPREIVVLKRLLQRELPEPVRAEIVRRLFAEHVTADETAFACELYMSTDQLACLRRQGMHIGCHGFSHAWLNHLSPGAQAMEIDRSLAFLQSVGVSADDWTICYPYGGFNESLLETLRARRCQLGFGVDARVADLDRDERLTLPRIDTNDLPS
ncbi:MAG: polysaccharide deacetylase family protein [Opitutaceae bacterium]|jgi:peptidoglycan/xylan/chitin deacetylase (PgdA/CDA1 family)